MSLSNKDFSKLYNNYLESKNEHKLKYLYFLMFFLFSIYLYTWFFQIDITKFMTHTSDISNFVFSTLFTALFFHASWFHLISNLVALFIFGRIVEKHLGVGLLFSFVLGGIFANALSNMVAHTMGASYYSLGASSGVAAIILLSILLNPISINTILAWVIIYFDISGLYLESKTNHLAHIAGYLSLVVIYFLLAAKNRKKIFVGFFINIFMIVLLYLILEFVLKS